MRVRAALAQLPPEQHEVVTLSYIDGLSHGEIAARLGLPLGTVKSRMRIAYQRDPRRPRGPEMTITHHLDDATLMSFAAGALPAALAAVAAAHADMCPRCRREIAAMERLGGAVMADLSPVAFDAPRAGAAHACAGRRTRSVPSRCCRRRRLKFPDPLRSCSAAASMPWRGGGWDPAYGTTLCR